MRRLEEHQAKLDARKQKQAASIAAIAEGRQPVSVKMDKQVHDQFLLFIQQHNVHAQVEEEVVPGVVNAQMVDNGGPMQEAAEEQKNDPGLGHSVAQQQVNLQSERLRRKREREREAQEGMSQLGFNK